MVSSFLVSTEEEEGVWHSSAHIQLKQGEETGADSAVGDELLGY